MPLLRRWTLGLAACVVAAAVAVGLIWGLGGLGAGRVVDPDPPPTCEDGATLDAESDSPLVEECELQLELLETLDSGDKLNWSAATDITEWDGVTVAGEDRHITKLALSNKGLAGELPERLVDLEQLTELRVDGNSLTGRIPSVLGNLRHLTHVYVSGNSFTGCYPPSWDDVANSDLAKLDIPSCAIPYNLHTTGDRVEGPQPGKANQLRCCCMSRTRMQFLKARCLGSFVWATHSIGQEGQTVTFGTR